VPDDPATPVPAGTAAPGPVQAPAPVTGEVAARRLAAVAAGHRGDTEAARRALGDPHPSVRAAALGALARSGALAVADLLGALADASPVVRRRACAEAGPVGGRGSRADLPAALRGALADPDPLVAEAACWALGERRVRAAVTDLSAVATGHPDARCREGAVAALGAIGERAGLPAVLAALGDKPAVRRRAAVALAGFDGPEVDEALRGCLTDRDWQVRQVAEILLGT
jgi:HEAT repeat protein